MSDGKYSCIRCGRTGREGASPIAVCDACWNDDAGWSNPEPSRLADLERRVAELETRKPANAPWTYSVETHNSLRCVCSCGAVDNGNGVFYCNDCWPHIEGKVQVADNVISPVAALAWGVAVACGFAAYEKFTHGIFAPARTVAYEVNEFGKAWSLARELWKK